MRREAAKGNPFQSVGRVSGATFVIGAEAGNVINVAIQLRDVDGAAVGERLGVQAYLASDANGDAAATPPTTLAIGTDGLLLRGHQLGAVAVLTDSSAGTANDTIESMADIATAGGNTYADSAVNAVIAKLRNNFADLAAKVNAVLNSARDFLLVSESNGKVDINIGKTGAATYYLVLRMPDGALVVSSVITFV